MSGHPALRLRGFHVNRVACLPALGYTVVAVAHLFETLHFICQICDVLGIVSAANIIVVALSCRSHADASHLHRCQMQPPMSTSDRVHRCFHSLSCTQIRSLTGALRVARSPTSGAPQALARRACRRCRGALAPTTLPTA